MITDARMGHYSRNLRQVMHDDVIKLKHFLRYWPFLWGIHRSPVNSPHKGQWRGVLMFSLIRAWTNGWVNNRDAGDLRRHHAHCDVTVMAYICINGIGNLWFQVMGWYWSDGLNHGWHIVNRTHMNKLHLFLSKYTILIYKNTLENIVLIFSRPYCVNVVFRSLLVQTFLM